MFKFLLAVCALLGQNLPAQDKGGRGVYVGGRAWRISSRTSWAQGNSEHCTITYTY